MTENVVVTNAQDIGGGLVEIRVTTEDVEPYTSKSWDVQVPLSQAAHFYVGRRCVLSLIPNPSTQAPGEGADSDAHAQRAT